eukprot:9497473-Pyramimonas_sp.AAC.1
MNNVVLWGPLGRCIARLVSARQPATAQEDPRADPRWPVARAKSDRSVARTLASVFCKREAWGANALRVLVQRNEGGPESMHET